MSNSVIICAALLGILIFLLGANVTRERAMRGDKGPQLPTEPDDRLLIAIRAHGNAAEYVPTLIGLLVIASTLTDGWWLNLLAYGALTARVLHAYGLLTTKSLADHGGVRDVGALLTYVTGLALGITVLVAL